MVIASGAAGCYFFIIGSETNPNNGQSGANMKLWRKPFDMADKAPRPVRVHISIDRCKGCGYCAEFCPRGVLKMTDELSPKGYNVVKVVEESKCLGCGLCEAMCPEFGIYVTAEEKEEEPVTHA